MFRHLSLYYCVLRHLSAIRHVRAPENAVSIRCRV
jgi:hypothetical protein